MRKGNNMITDDILSYIEEKPIFCTRCEDYKYINSIEPYPCPSCNLEEYKEWKAEQSSKSDKKKK